MDYLNQLEKSLEEILGMKAKYQPIRYESAKEIIEKYLKIEKEYYEVEILNRIDFYLRLRYLIQYKIHEDGSFLGKYEKIIDNAMMVVAGWEMKGIGLLRGFGEFIGILKHYQDSGIESPIEEPQEIFGLRPIKYAGEIVYKKLYVEYKLGHKETVITRHLFDEILKELNDIDLKGYKFKITTKDILKEVRFANWCDYLTNHQDISYKKNEFLGRSQSSNLRKVRIRVRNSRRK